LELTGSQKNIVTEVFRQDLRALDEGTEKIFSDICRVLSSESQKKRKSELSRLISEAEKKGDKSSQEAYSAEQLELNRRLKNLR
jgi:hypothetical protein